MKKSIALYFILTFVMFVVSIPLCAQNDSINQLLINEVKVGRYDEAKYLILNEEANPNYIDTVVITTGGSSGGVKPVQGGGFFGAFVNLLMAPVMIITSVIEGIAGGSRGIDYEINTILELTLKNQIKKDKLSFVELLLKKGANPNQDGQNYAYPINIATENDEADICILLLEYGADIELASTHNSIIGSAIRNNNEDLAIFYLKEGANPLESDKWNEVPLLKAIHKKQTNFIQQCIDFEVDFSLQENQKHGTYFEAILTKDEEILNIVEETLSAVEIEKQLIDYSGETPFHHWAKSQSEININWLEKIEEKHPNLILQKNKKENTALDIAIKNAAEDDLLLWLINKNVPCQEVNRLSLINDSTKDREIKEKLVLPHEEIILWQHDFDNAIINKEYSNLPELYMDGIDIKPSHLYDAVFDFNFDGTTFLLENGANPNDSVSYGRTTFEHFAYHCFSINKYSDVLKYEKMLLLLLQHGADVRTDIVIESLQEGESFILTRHCMDYGLQADELFALEKWYEDDLHHYIEEYQTTWNNYERIIPKYENGHFTLLNQTYENAYAFQLSVARVKKNGQWFLIDVNGDYLTVGYDSIGSFQYKYENYEEATALILKDGQYNYINRDGQELFPVDFDAAVSFENVYAENRYLYSIVEKNDLFAVARDNGTLATKMKYDSIISPLSFKYDKVEVITQKGKQKFVTLKTYPNDILLK